MRTTNNRSYDLQNTISKNHLVGIWRLMHGYHLPYLGANGCLAFAAIFKVSMFLLLRYFVDNVLGEPDISQILPIIAAGFVLIAVMEGIFTYVSGRLAAYTAENIVLRLREFLFDHLQRLSFAYHSKTKTGEIIQRASSDVDTIRRFYSEQSIGIGRILLLFVVIFLAIFHLNNTLAFLSIIIIPLVFILSLFFFRKISNTYEDYQNQEATLSTILQENLSGIRVVKAFARQRYESEKFEKENWEKFLKGKKLILLYSLYWPLTDILCGFQMLAGYFIGAMMAINGIISIGTYLAYAGLVIWLIFPMRNLGRLIVQTSEGLVSYQRVMEIIKEHKEPLDDGKYSPDHPIEGAISFKHVSFEYEDSESNVLKDITFDCQPGQVIALLGYTGSGKTSLVNLLPRFFEYSTGSITLDNIELSHYSRSFLRDQVGIVEQEPFLFSRTIRENILYGTKRKTSQDEIEEVAKAAAIHDVIMSFPQGYKTMVGERGVTLSGGQKQRIAIARTLLKNPRILILDDSTSSIDAETEYEIKSALNKLMQGRTTFIIAHRIETVMNADLILVMDSGDIIQMGTHEELIAQDGVYAEIHQIQNRLTIQLQNELQENYLEHHIHPNLD
jgi:ATP-binding cassette, subfamily B, bacterial